MTNGIVHKSGLLCDVVSETADEIHSWADFENFYTSLDLGAKARWCFRGQRNHTWRLETLLERVTAGNRDRLKAERYFIRAFQRRAHHFLQVVPSFDDLLEWLALMQHWGVPTRLLDFTTSPYIGLFFALNDFLQTGDGSGQERFAALWAVHHVACKGIAVFGLNQAGIEGLPRLAHETPLGSPEYFRRCFFGDLSIPFVAPLQPFRLNERQAVQQGMFLCASNLKLSFEETLVQLPEFQEHIQAKLPGTPEDLVPRVQHNLKRLIRKAIISERGAVEILPRLYSMNLNSGSLFPDLQGYAQSITERYKALQLMPTHEKEAVGFDALNEIDSLG